MTDHANPTRPLALVTGASSGIGRTFAHALARRGHDLVLVARDRDRLVTLASELHRDHGAAAEVLPADLTDPTALRTVEARLARAPGIALLVNNAGFGTVGRFERLDPEREEAEIRLNVLALVRLTRAALPAMVTAGRGAIINVSSMAGFLPGPFTATYNATKAFVNSFSEAIAEEVRDRGVRVQALLPGFTRTEFQERAGINSAAVPGFAWMSAEAVVEASLAALARGRTVCIPGASNRLAAVLTRLVPRRLLARMFAASFPRQGLVDVEVLR